MTTEPLTMLYHRRIVLGVTGSIAVYKAVDLASKLTQAGALVDVIMTEAARRFVAPITFESVTGRPAYTTMWATAEGALPTHIAHVGLGEGADLLVIAPITAHTIARLAHGLADDLLAVTTLAARCPVLIAPAMDGGMYAHPATQDNLATLRARGVASIMINSNPETVSTDFDASSRLYFEPLDAECVQEVLANETTPDSTPGVVVQFGGQTAINLAEPLARAGAHVLGSSVEAIDLAEDRHRFEELVS